MKDHISYLFKAFLEYYPLHRKVHQVQRKQTDSHKVCSKCPLLARTQARKRVGHWLTVSSISDCSKRRHTCSRRCRRLAAHQCHERDSDVIFKSHV